MTEEQFQKFEDFITAKIIEHNSLAVEDSVRLMNCREELREALGLPAYPPKV